MKFPDEKNLHHFSYYRYIFIYLMDELSLIIQSLIDSEVDDMILDLVYEIHSSIKGFPQEQFQITKTISIDKQTCICPNCGQTNLIATRFAYHLAKCLGENK